MTVSHRKRRMLSRAPASGESTSNELIDIGAPIDPSVLESYEFHVASKIWSGDDGRPPIDVHNRHRTLNMWPLDNECQFVRDVVESASLTTLAKHSHKNSDRAMVDAFTERYYPETNTFHLPFGEMTIGSDDVFNILGLKMEGTALDDSYGNQNSIPFDEAVTLVHEQLGISREQAHEEMKRTRTLRLSWLRENFMGSTEEDTEVEKRQAARAYMLYLIGTVVMPNKTGDKVGVYHLQNLVDLQSVGEISWGSATLAHLYRELGVASRCMSLSITGCVSLLQTWIYEHFPSLGRCGAVDTYNESMPRVCKWIPIPGTTELKISSRNLREQLDDLTVDAVVWDPYRDYRAQFPLKEILFYMGFLHCYDIVEPYYPDRILRQLGWVQTIPIPPIKTDVPRTGTSGSNYKCVYSLQIWNWEQWQDHCLPDDRRSRPVAFPGECSRDYIEWFSSVSHIRVQNLNRRAREIPKTIGGAPATGKFRSRLMYILDLLRCRGAADRPLSPTSRLALAADLIEKYEVPENLSTFGEVRGEEHVEEDVAGEEIGSEGPMIGPTRLPAKKNKKTKRRTRRG